MATKAERITELLGIIDNKSVRIKRLKLECGQQSTQICVLNLRTKELEELLIEYGRHSPGCSAQFNTTHSKYPCRCGWDRERKQALKG